MMNLGKKRLGAWLCGLLIVSILTACGADVNQTPPENEIAGEIENAVADEITGESADENSAADEITGESADKNNILTLWTDDAEAKNELIAYMDAVTDENGADYIPTENRIAVFDLDGTLFCD